MSTATFQPGKKKAADFLVHVHPQTLKANGIQVALMYTKNTTRAHIDGYLNAGLGVILIHQRGYEGKGPNPATDGLRHGVEAERQAKALGYPLSMPIIAASAGDYDNTAATRSGSVAYWNAFRQANGYPSGIYGDTDMFDWVGNQGLLNTQAAAKSWSWDRVRNIWRGPHPQADMLQYPSKVIRGVTPTKLYPGTAIDFNDILVPVKAWVKDTSVKPSPPPTGPKPPLPPPTGTPIIVPLPTLTVGSEGPEVRALQRTLSFWNWGYRGFNIDGKFGARTRLSTMEMQRVLKVDDDGIYGPVTTAALTRFLVAMRDLAAARGVR